MRINERRRTTQKRFDWLERRVNQERRKLIVCKSRRKQVSQQWFLTLTGLGLSVAWFAVEIIIPR